jgi:hypothetical protein
MEEILRRAAQVLATGTALFLLTQVPMHAQRGAAPEASSGPPVDLTGYYVSIVTEDWRYRMVTPAKGDYASVPLSAAGRKLADAWDPAKDESSGDQCKSYGAPAIMRVPGRIHVTQPDPNTFQIETDAGTQTRAFHLNAPPSVAAQPTWQGYSVASWDIPGGRGRGGETSKGGSLKVVTNHLKPGYLRKNGVPYSAKTVVTEYYSKTMEPNGDSWLIITTIVEDPEYLNGPFVTSTHFKRQPDSTGWAPSSCTSR